MQEDLSIRYTDEIRTSKHAKRQFRELAHRAIEAADLGEGCAVHAQAIRQGTTYTFTVEVTEGEAEPRTVFTYEGFPLGGAGSDEAFDALCATLGLATPAGPEYEALEAKEKAARAKAVRKAKAAGARPGVSGRRGSGSGMSASRGSGPNPRQRHRPTGG